MITLLKEIFSQKKYTALFFISAFVMWMIVGIYQHGETFRELWGIVSIREWFLFVLNFSDLVIANLSLLGLIVLIANIVGISMYITLKTYAYQLHTKTKSALGVVGSVLVFFGVGCASCGSLALVSVVSFLGFGSALALLPFAGGEIPYIALVLLIVSNVVLMRQLAKKVCPV